MKEKKSETLIFILLMLLIPGITYSDDRRFSYVYESTSLAKNETDLEVWSTYRGGRVNYYSRFDHRMEFEIGLTDKLQTALYLNFRNVTQADPVTGDYNTNFEWDGISSEWKYRLLNKYRDGIGFSPYLELAFNTREAELETKLIFDKNLSKKFIAAFNIVGEYEWEFNPGAEKTSKEFTLEFDLGLAYDVSNNLSFGIEARSHNDFPNGEGLKHAALFVGPNMSYRTEKWFFYINLSAAGQAIKKSVNMKNSNLILDDHERNNLRLILGFTL